MSVLNTKSAAGISICLFLLLSIIATTPSWAAKFYKWTDQDGVVHYTQTPPNKTQIKDKSSVTEKSNSAGFAVTHKKDYAYCGNLQLPGPLYEPKSIIMSLSSKTKYWSNALQRSEQNLRVQLRQLGNSNNRRSYGGSYRDNSQDHRKGTAREIKEYRCALAWAERQKKKYSDIKDEISHNLKGAKSSYQTALKAAHQDCGFEPKDFAAIDYNERKSGWKRCMNHHNRQINASKRNLNQLRRESGNLD